MGGGGRLPVFQSSACTPVESEMPTHPTLLGRRCVSCIAFPIVALAIDDETKSWKSVQDYFSQR